MRPIALLLLLAAPLWAAPWWDDFPTTVQTSNPGLIEASGADSALCGFADDPCWGILGQRIRYLPGQGELDAQVRDGLKRLVWSEAFGTCEQYIAEFQRGPDGKLVGFSDDPTTPRPRLNHWGWHTWKPLPDRERHWVGLAEYYADEAWLRPWTRTHPRYGAPPFTYPDGRVARDEFEAAPGINLHRLYDAGCAKDILGNVALHCGLNERLNEIDPETGTVRGPTDGLVPWETRDGIRYSGVVSAGKDSACPHWIEYAKASARHMADCGVQGLWADNFSAWDAFGNPPLRTAFGDWSVHRFREYLKARFSPERLREMAIEDADSFDIRAYLRRVLRETYGGDDTNPNDPHWSDAGWLDDPVWREFAIYKVQVGREALRAYHDTFHEAAREAGIDDFVIQGNDIPLWCFDMPRPEWLEMVSTEFAPGWNLLTGPRGNGLPPGGRMSAIVKMARTHAQSRFVHFWYYLDGASEKYRGNAALGRVLSYELLAHHAMIQSQPGQAKVAGTPDSHADVNAFIRAARGVWGDRRPLAKIGLLYSPMTRLAAQTPGPRRDFAEQPHAFDLIGWGTALSELHQQYSVIAGWNLTGKTLRPLSALLLPSVDVLSPEAVQTVIRPWVSAGGTLIISGPTGGRYDATRSHERVANAAEMLPELCSLTGLDSGAPLPARHEFTVGRGRVILLPALGLDYFQQQPGERDLSPIEPAVRQYLSPHGIVQSPLPRELEVSVFGSPTRPMIFIDIANLDLDPDVDDRPAPHEVTLSLALDEPFDAGPSATLLQPGREPEIVPVRREGGRLSVGPIRVESYVSLAIAGTP